MKARNFQDDIPSIPIDNLKDHYVLVFDLTTMQDAAENCNYAELVGESVRKELNSTFALKHVTELIVLGERKSSVAIDKFGVVGKKTSRMDNVWLHELVNCIPLHTSWYYGSFP